MRSSALPRGLNADRLRVPNFGPNPRGAYDQVLDDDETDSSLERPELSLDDEEFEDDDDRLAKIDEIDDPEVLKRFCKAMARVMMRLRAKRGNDTRASDEPPLFEGRPRSGGKMDAIDRKARAQDGKRSRVMHAHDAEPGFFGRFPGARRIDFGM